MSKSFSDLDEEYREEGWGRITDAALSIKPHQVESQARDVARYAFRKIDNLETRLREAKDELSRLRYPDNTGQ